MHAHAKVYVFRLRPHEDLKKAVLAFARERQIKAGIMLTCVGSLEQFHLRFANRQSGTKQNGHFEILSCAGTFSDSSCHLHLALANEDGHMTGGHLLDGNLVYTTAEIAIAELSEFIFERVHDPAYGYPELVIHDKRSAS